MNETIRLNGLSDRCDAYQLALAAAEGVLPLFDNPESASASHLAVNRDTLVSQGPGVQVSTVDIIVDELRLDRLDLIKIDVEGFEPDVIEGAMNTIRRLKPKVFLEFNSFTLIAFRNVNPRTLLEHLLNVFSRVSWLSDGQRIDIKGVDGTIGFLHSNLIKHGCVNDLLCEP